MLVTLEMIAHLGAEVSKKAAAAGLFPRTRENRLSFADRACLALAMELELKAVLYTADRRLAETRSPVRVVLIRATAERTAKKKWGEGVNSGGDWLKAGQGGIPSF